MILAILQARFSSSRFRGKVLKPILGVPMLALQIERIKRAKLIDYLLVATSKDVTDDAIENLCININVGCYRGNLEDVLDRFYQAAKLNSPEHIVRLTGDCPLADPELIDEVIKFYLTGDFDYASNALEPTYPDGLDVEICRFKCLEQAWKEAKLPSQREHVTPFINQQPHLFHIGVYKNNSNLSHLRWTVDEQLDFDLIANIYEALYPNNPKFATQDILDFLEVNSYLKNFNTCYQRNEGWQKSLLVDELFLNKIGED
ncbi:spore coat protein [Nostoc sp. 'Peltigera membranacea cyanobiont' 210A]|uniref:cytidylyltransferase domain-containing protein n=1 Tax=Nostoc sp. 'Peltigera membranacea cyanobiont' 210A TaxID=2014529 RepID=UPI000B955E1D|nr:glycosyltransferase family protein [Nostoc sp. 'Peltigera membranacea cyanobiont' 210A]OYD97822.1 spore coat protein [Nostoc sp. 'Peltigera membranacea cyanobiont' 210A]